MINVTNKAFWKLGDFSSLSSDNLEDCIDQFCKHNVTVENLFVTNKRIKKDLLFLLNDPPEYLLGIDFLTRTPDNKLLGLGWECVIYLRGTKGTSYDKVHKLKLFFSPKYPFVPPRACFSSLFFHPQVLPDIGQLDDIFYHSKNLDWHPECRLGHFLSLVMKMMTTLLYEPPYSIEAIKQMWASSAPFMLTKSKEEQIRAINSFQKHLNEVIRPKHFQTMADYMANRLKATKEYKPLYPELFESWRKEWFDPLFLSAIEIGTPEALKSILKQESPSVYSFQMFNPYFCSILLEELMNYENSNLPKQRPNSMNNYGLILNDIGYEELMDELVEKYIRPLSSLLYSEWHGKTIDRHHSFMVQYMEGQDINLDMHVDDAEVTLNVCLNNNFTGSGLTFCGCVGQPEFFQYRFTFTHLMGRAVLHPGKQRHGADNILSGSRYNLIVWCRSTEYRLSPEFHKLLRHPKENTPDMICLAPAERMRFKSGKKDFLSDRDDDK
eukprot:TRINITY_DN1635_c0_g3_i1.p1 TRINITY_DN1635_c0_g3~~TRINITY_DN1635_c0_g3_i1.p1  ORF type:complete len:495 (-),score=52.89 TRINITY_DN1635_c0_g3_i1:62-1546(-)